uniref:glutathione transferase n=1 Tax=Pinus tabuliformis TaxID=88731 RepID=L7S1P8_PINTB|nr:tau class glutathione S-transferase [Pinus tabuliformis]
METCAEQVQVKLLGGRSSPFMLRVRIALALKGIHYEHIKQTMNHTSELLLKSNPVHKKIPVLIHNCKPVCESTIIVQYINETWDTRAPFIMPKDPYDRTIALWSAFIDDKLLPCIQAVFSGQGEQYQKAAEEMVANFLIPEEALRTNLYFSRKEYFRGDGIGFVDIALGGLLAFLKSLEKGTDSVLIGAEKMPLLSAWMDRFCEADGVKEVMPDPVKLLEFICATRVKFAFLPAANYRKSFGH